jgi:hypothetical protein
MAKDNFGTARTPDQIARSRRDGNPGGERRPGYLLKHVVLGGSSHVARFVEANDALYCSVCGKEV